MRSGKVPYGEANASNILLPSYAGQGFDRRHGQPSSGSGKFPNGVDRRSLEHMLAVWIVVDAGMQALEALAGRIAWCQLLSTFAPGGSFLTIDRTAAPALPALVVVVQRVAALIAIPMGL